MRIPAFAFLIFLTILINGSAMAAEIIPIRTISVSGLAKREVVPDEAHLTVNLNAMEPKLDAAKITHDAKLKKLMGMIKDAGIDEKKIRTQASGIQPVYSYTEVTVKPSQVPCDTSPCMPQLPGKTKNIRVLDGYRAQTTVDITVGDTAKLGGLMDSISKAEFEKGATQDWGNMLSVYYTLSNPEHIRDEMLTEAIANAKLKAAKMAAAVDSSIARVYQINESGTPSFDFPRPMIMRSAEPSMLAMAKSINLPAMAPPAGEQEVNASVTIVFELK